MFCSKCGLEIVKEEKNCSNCGNVIKKGDIFNTTKVFITLIFLIVIIGGFIGYSKYKQKENIKAMEVLTTSIGKSSINCGNMISEALDIWSNSIKLNTLALSADPFNILRKKFGVKTPEEAIFALRVKWGTEKKTQEMEKEKEKIEEQMKALKNIKNGEIIDRLRDYYITYEKIYLLAISPSGSYLNYSSEATRLFIELKEKRSRLDLILPSN